MSSSPMPSFDSLTIPIGDLPSGYEYRVTRYADVILRDSFPTHWNDLIETLTRFHIDVVTDIYQAGGNRSTVAIRFDGALQARGWGKRNIDISTTINEQLVAKVRSHEIDMFKLGAQHLFPGVAVEMEWNNKDPSLTAIYPTTTRSIVRERSRLESSSRAAPAYNKDYKNATDKDLELRQHIGVSLCPASILAAAANAHFSW